MLPWVQVNTLFYSKNLTACFTQTEHRATTAGLGAKGGTYGALPGETYKDCVKKMMFARYQELTEQEHDT